MEPTCGRVKLMTVRRGFSGSRQVAPATTGAPLSSALARDPDIQGIRALQSLPARHDNLRQSEGQTVRPGRRQQPPPLR
jgi:hypothetical protein